jgi:hypothetical protein
MSEACAAKHGAKAATAGQPGAVLAKALDDVEPRVKTGPAIAFEQKERDYLLWGCFRWSFASASTPAGCLLQLIHGLDEAREARNPIWGGGTGHGVGVGGGGGATGKVRETLPLKTDIFCNRGLLSDRQTCIKSIYIVHSHGHRPVLIRNR